jgi:cystathionine beta-lyase/cystathionine gamma-synthase
MKLDPRDVAICLGTTEDLAPAHGAIMPPVVQTSLFAHETFDALCRSLAAEHDTFVYSRGRNPTVAVLEEKLAALERGEAAQCFASGMGAIAATMVSLVAAGDHVLFVNQVYGPTLQLAARLAELGVTHSRLVEPDRAPSPDDVAAAVRPETRLIWMESPGTMLNRVLDVRGITALARSRGILTVIDNSWSTPLLQKPLTMGVDVAIHTGTKYIGGHSDVVGGALVTSRELHHRIFHRGLLLLGAALGPWDAWLLIRGLRTLPVRLRQHEANAQAVVGFLTGHSAVAEVYYPGLGGDRALVDAQMTGGSGLVSFRLARGDFGAVSRVIDALRSFRIGVSWGGVESLVISPQRPDNAEGLREAGLPSGLVRLSVGLEDRDALLADLEQALAHA